MKLKILIDYNNYRSRVNFSIRNSVFIGKRYKAMTLMELILVMGLFSIVMITGMVMVLQSFNVGRDSNEKNRARLLAIEGIEAVKSIKNNNWDDINSGTFRLNGDSGLPTGVVVVLALWGVVAATCPPVIP